MKKFSDLSEQEILALAISLEEEDERIYADFADALRDNFPATAALLSGMGAEETVHRQKLTELCRKKFGGHIPLIRKQDVKGFVQRKPLWLVRPLGLEAVRRFTASMPFHCHRAPDPAVEEPQTPPPPSSEEKERILRALRDCRGHQGKAANLLQVSRSTLFRKMRKFGIT